MWQRTLFFWLESLQITAGERRVVLTLVVISLILSGISIISPPRTIYDDHYYEPVIAEFKRLSEIREKKRSVQLAQYYPPDSAGVIKAEGPGIHKAEEPETNKMEGPGTNKMEPVNIRYAGKKELMTLPGIGPVTAESIIAYREKKGSLEKPKDLLNVSGIGPVTLENIRHYIHFERKENPD